MVDTTTDANLTACTATPDDCSLRGAIGRANLNSEADTIAFAIPGDVKTIALNSSLPSLSADGTFIDGTTQAGYGGLPLIEIVGSGPSGQSIGLTIRAAHCHVRALNLHGWPTAIVISGSGATKNRVEACFIGPDATGTKVPETRNNIGVLINNGAQNNVIGGANRAERNIISANTGAGILISGTQTNGNHVKNNFLGTNRSGQALGKVEQRQSYGVLVQTVAQSNFIGGGLRGEGNLISGNARAGIRLENANNQSVGGNIIGLSSDGAALGNGIIFNSGTGVEIFGNSQNNIIGRGIARRNIISGNPGYGVRISDAPGSSARFNVIESNYIGTDATGTQARGNESGVLIAGNAHDNSIGAKGEGRNLISGNKYHGVLVSSFVKNTSIIGNYIGTNAAGIAALDAPQVFGGINLGHAENTKIESNVIAGCGGDGITLFYAHNNQISGNFIGVDATGQSKLPNDEYGILVLNSSGNTIGGAGAMRNVISGNRRNGIRISGAGSDNNIIAGNIIGLNARGDAVLGNGGAGVAVLEGAKGCRIGNRTAGLNNLIAGNGGAGIVIGGAQTSGHFVFNNYIGLDVTGTKSGFGNRGPGVLISDNAVRNYIGVAGPFGRNVVAGNATNILLSNANSNRIKNNFIGLQANGLHSVYADLSTAPTATGIVIQNGDFNSIGGSLREERNVISGNAGYGIELGGKGNLVAGNFIGLTDDGTTAAPNAYSGLYAKGRDHVIGGTTIGARNVIAGNGIRPATNQTATSPLAGSGLYIENPINVKVQGNFIGLDAFGRAALANQAHGIFSTGGSFFAVSLVIGGATNRPGTGAGNVISGNALSGVSSDISSIVGNLIGTDFTGTRAVPNQNGVDVRGYATALGSFNPQGRNIISGNRNAGVICTTTASSKYNSIGGNFIGTDLNGRTAIPNTYGIYSVTTASVGNITTKPGTGNGNVISGNTREGIYAAGGAVVFGNAIGVAADGTTPLPNGAGITIVGSGTIGGQPLSNRTGNYQNIIAYNHGVGVRVTGRADIRANRIFANDGLGIDQGEAGITPGLAVDSEVGPIHKILFFPVLNAATQSAPDAPLIIQGYVQGNGVQQAIDVFASDAPDESGYGEGQIYLGTFNVATRPDAPFITFNQVLDVQADLTGKYITATNSLALSFSNTSEFSKVVQVIAAQGSTESSYTTINGTAYGSSASIVIAFDTRLQSVALENLSAKVNGQPIMVQSVDIRSQVLTVLLPEGSFQAGDKIEVFWRDLQAGDGRLLTGNTPPLDAE